MTEINSSQTPQLPAKPDPKLKHLDVFVGKWNTVGEMKASPYGPDGRSSEPVLMSGCRADFSWFTAWMCAWATPDLHGGNHALYGRV